MKIKILYSFLVLSLAFGAVGCLNDDPNPLDPGDYRNVIEFGNIAIPSSPANAVHPLWSVAFDFSPQEQFDIIISYSGPNDNTKDIAVTLKVDPFVLDAYNADQSSTYDLLPTDFYSFNPEVTIPKGQKQIKVTITVFPDKFDLSKSYALPLRIVSSSSGIISGNWGAAVFGTVAKNQYHGTYKSTGYFQHPSVPRPINQEKDLITISSNSCMTGHSDLGTPLIITVNPDNTVALLDDTFGSYLLPPIVVDGETYDNTYHPDTKTFYLHYEYVGGTGLRTIYEKLVFQN